MAPIFACLFRAIAEAIPLIRNKHNVPRLSFRLTGNPLGCGKNCGSNKA